MNSGSNMNDKYEDKKNGGDLKLMDHLPESAQQSYNYMAYSRRNRRSSIDTRKGQWEKPFMQETPSFTL